MRILVVQQIYKNAEIGLLAWGYIDTLLIHQVKHMYECLFILLFLELGRIRLTRSFFFLSRAMSQSKDYQTKLK
jgi:hypothetical protein